MAVSCCSSDDPDVCTSDAKLSSDEVRQTYSRIAPIYDIWSSLTESRASARAFELAAPADGEAILEVAVGTGTNFKRLVKANPSGRNIGVDLTPAMLSRARERLRQSTLTNFELFEGDAFALPVGDESVDLLVNQYMFDLIPLADFPRLINEFKRVLKPDGRLVLVNMTLSETRLGHVYEAVYRRSPKLMGGCRGVRLAPSLQAAGFRVECREYHQQSFFPSEVVLAYRN